MDLKRVLVVRAIDGALRDENGPCTAWFDWAERRTGVHRMKLFLVLVLVAAAYLAGPNTGTVVLGNAIGFLYPAYKTVAMLLRPPTDDHGRAPPRRRPPSVAGYRQQQQQRQQRDRRRSQQTARWFVYWMVFAAALIVHHAFGGLLGRFVPFYGLIRVAVFVWCFAPVPTNGADFVHELIVRRYFANHFAGGHEDTAATTTGGGDDDDYHGQPRSSSAE